LTVPPGTRRPTHTPSPTGQLPTATTLSPTATLLPTATSVPTDTPTATLPSPTVTVGATATATVTQVATVENGDSGSQGLQVGLKERQICVAENSGTIAVGLRLSKPPDGTVTVDVRTLLGGGGTLASANVDFELSNATIAFFNSQQDAVINFSLINDNLVEGDETFLLEISQVHNDIATIDPTAAVAEIIILDDDDESQETDQYDCRQLLTPGQFSGGLAIAMDSDEVQPGVGGLVPLDIVLVNQEAYTLTQALLQVTIPTGMALVLPQGQMDVTGDVLPLDTTWQQLEGEISAAAPNGLAGEADILLRLGDIRPDAQATVPLLLEISPDFDLDRQTVVDVRLSAIHPDREQSWLRVASQAVEIAPTSLPQETEPVIKLFLPLVISN